MLKRIINFEINEIYPQLIMDYIADEKYKNSTLRKLFYKKLIKIYTTKAMDVEESKLYPSQSWASFNSGEPYEKHKCYWYSDFINSKKMIWSKLVDHNKSVGIIGSIHSSKYPEDLFLNNNYLFYLPDCFSNQNTSKPYIYENFQELNNQLVEGSARVTNSWNLVFVFAKNLFKILINPRSFGIGIFSVKSILKILFFSIKTRNKELLRMGQFPLIAQIFYNLFKLKKPDYSSLFSNHIAGNLHRYMYAHNIDAFTNKNKYSEKWIKRNRHAINFSINLFDDFLGFILNKKEFIDSTIVITSSIGQKPTENFSEKNLSKFDGKIIDLDKFIKQLIIYQKKVHQISVEYKYERNMAPQYGIKVKDLKNYQIIDIVNSIKKFLSNLNLKNDVELEGSSIVISINPYEDFEIQKKYTIKKANILYSKYGLKFFSIDDHHSGSHCKEGLLAIYNPSNSLQNNLRDMLEEDGSLDYLNFQRLVIDYLKN